MKALFDFFRFGETVAGYSIPVLNEREARAAAGILFVLGLLSFLYAYNTMDFRYTKIFILFFMFDFILRVLINPAFAPSLIAGRLLVSGQVPEYVGAPQKRFAWSIGLILSVIMFVLVVILEMMTPIKIAICVLCLILLFSETALGICLGCLLYQWLFPKKIQYCPGDICLLKQKHAIQKVTLAQLVLVFIAFASVSILAYQAFQEQNVDKTSTGMPALPQHGHH